MSINAVMMMHACTVAGPDGRLVSGSCSPGSDGHVDMLQC